MTEYLRLTSQTFPWFLPLLPPAFHGMRARDPSLCVLGAVRDGTACGALVFRAGRELADIRFLSVARPFRRQGIASGMIRHLCRCAWPSATPVTCSFAAADRGDPVYLLFAGLDTFSVAEEEGYRCRVPLEGLARSPELAPLRGRGREPLPFFSLPPAQRQAFLRDLLRQDVCYLRELEEALLDRPLCLCTRGRSGLSAALFVSRLGEDRELSFAWSAPGAQNDLMGLLAAACGQLPPSGWLYLSAVTPSSAAIVDRLLPRRIITERYYRAVWDMEL